MIYAIKTLNEEQWKRSWEFIQNKSISSFYPYIDPSGYYTKILNKWAKVTVISYDDFFNGTESLISNKEIAVTEEIVQRDKKIENELLILNEDYFSNYSSIVSSVYEIFTTHRFNNLNELKKYLALKREDESTSTILASYQGIQNLDFFDDRNLLLNNSGVITANNVEELSWIILKGILSSLDISDNELVEKENHVILPSSKKQFKTPSENTIVYNNESTMLDSFNELINKSRINSFYISTHGSEDCILLTDSIVCGQSKRHRGIGMDCKINEKCPIHKKGILAADIPADFVINSTCFGYRPFNTILPTAVTLSNAFLDNFASVYISSVGIKHGPDAEICLLHNLLLSGYSAGNAVKILNNWLYQNNIDFPCYLVIGNPNQRYKGITLEKREESYILEEEAGGSFRITINDIKGRSFVKIRIEDSLKDHSLIENTSKLNFYYSIVTENGNRYLYLYSWQNFNRERLEVILHSNLPQKDFDDYHLSEIEKQIVGNKFENETLELTNMITESSSLIKSISYDPNSYYKLRKHYKKLSEKYWELNQNIIDKLMNKASSAYSIFLPEMYIQQVQMLNDSAVEKRCFICSNKAKDYTFKNPATNEERFLTYCPKCGCISDMAQRNKLKLEIIGESNIPNSGVFTQKLMIKNTSNKDLKGYAFLTHLGLEEWSRVNKSRIEFDLEPGGILEKELEFEIMKEIQPSIYYFKSMAIIDSELYYSNKPLFFYKTFNL
ncbi:hypothetical protein [Rossellomorea aquimaris]|uniref:hypothetical protein n=1 Tax=Rossellomorea aquimaris TaxID=189382 RepID=UPI0011E8E773|nr:hypothetical protein [Rossellomorea aquimaris]TYS83516.1 hypothetical protein FZC88_23420 [Rossellomorea aquimaris]